MLASATHVGSMLALGGAAGEGVFCQLTFEGQVDEVTVCAGEEHAAHVRGRGSKVVVTCALHA